MTNRTYPTPPGIPPGSRIAGQEFQADGRPTLAKGHMMLSGKVMWDNAYAPIPFDPDTMIHVARPEPAWRQASREQAESTRVVFSEPMPLSLLERAKYWAAIAEGTLEEWEKQKKNCL